jgi:hypothetical protein
MAIRIPDQPSRPPMAITSPASSAAIVMAINQTALMVITRGAS